MEPVSREILRIIDANLDRVGEGLRVLEDVARLALNSPVISRHLKEIRHKTVHTVPALDLALLQARDSNADVGRNTESSDQKDSRDLTGTVIANARRVQEGLRVLEDISRTPGRGLESNVYKEARFNLYSIEKELVAALTRREKLVGLQGLCISLDIAAGVTPLIAEKAVRGGAKIVKLRPVTENTRHNLQTAIEAARICHAHSALLIIESRVDLVLASGSDGVCLGGEDLPIEAARSILPIQVLIGFTTDTLEGASAAREDGADFLVSAASEGTLLEMKRSGLPIIRNIGAKDVISPLVETGAEVIALEASFLGGTDIEATVRGLIHRLEGKTQKEK